MPRFPRRPSMNRLTSISRIKLLALATLLFVVLPYGFDRDRLGFNTPNFLPIAAVQSSHLVNDRPDYPDRRTGIERITGNSAIAAEIAAPTKSKQTQPALDPRLELAKQQRQLLAKRMLQELPQWQFEPCGEGTTCYDKFQKYAKEIDSLDRFIIELEPDYSPWFDGLPGLPDPREDRNATLTQYEDSIDRQLLYEFLVAQRLAQSSAQAEQLEAILTMGGPGSGKSTVLRQLDLCQTGTIINADDFKADLVEYQVALAAKDRLAASRVHEESSLMARRTRNESIHTKRSFCWDGTLSDREEALRLIEILQSRGYHVTVIGAMLPTQLGIERVIARGERTGRFIPLEVVTDSYEQIAQHAEEVAIAADRGYLYNTNVAFGKEPPLVARYEKGEPQFQDAEFLRRLKAGEL
jgi:predicted ABC-type ATPase